MGKNPELYQLGNCQIPSVWGFESCRGHLTEWRRVQDLAMDAALTFGDSQQDPASFWEAVDNDPAWRRRWWERKPEGRRPIHWSIKRLVALAHGGRPGEATAVECPRCGVHGEIHWDGKVPRFLGMHIDHIRPVTKGGGNEPENLRLLCPTCNIRRGNREVA